MNSLRMSLVIGFIASMGCQDDSMSPRTACSDLATWNARCSTDPEDQYTSQDLVNCETKLAGSTQACRDSIYGFVDCLSGAGCDAALLERCSPLVAPFEVNCGVSENGSGGGGTGGAPSGGAPPPGGTGGAVPGQGGMANVMGGMTGAPGTGGATVVPGSGGQPVATGMCPRPDAFEENDTPMQASMLAPGAGPLVIEGTITGNDPDYFTFVTPLRNPFKVVLEYARPPGDKVDLGFVLYNGSGDALAYNLEARKGDVETTWRWQQPTSAGDRFIVKVSSDGGTICADYKLTLDLNVCGDEGEPNDTFAGASPLQTGVERTFTISYLDDDYYKLEGLNGQAPGSCTVSYAVPVGSTEDLEAFALSATGSTLKSYTQSRTQDTEIITMSWDAGKQPFAIRVRASKYECTSYKLICKN